jgi:hypothetical protein
MNIRFFVIAIVLIASVGSGVLAQKNDSKVEQELIQVERDIGQANIRRDKAFFEKVEADEFIFTDSGGGVTTKAEDVASLDKPAGDNRLVAYDLSDMRVKVYGNTAVVTAIGISTYKSRDKEAVIKNRFTDVFVRRDGRWQLVAGHSSRIREPQK